MRLDVALLKFGIPSICLNVPEMWKHSLLDSLLLRRITQELLDYVTKCNSWSQLADWRMKGLPGLLCMQNRPGFVPWHLQFGKKNKQFREVPRNSRYQHISWSGGKTNQQQPTSRKQFHSFLTPLPSCSTLQPSKHTDQPKLGAFSSLCWNSLKVILSSETGKCLSAWVTAHQWTNDPSLYNSFIKNLGRARLDKTRGLSNPASCTFSGPQGNHTAWSNLASPPPPVFWNM